MSMNKVLKFRKAAGSANDADEAYYVPSGRVKFVETSAASVIVYVLGRGADSVEDDTITITCGAGDELAIADKLLGIMQNPVQPGVIEVGVDFYAGITTIAYAVA